MISLAAEGALPGADRRRRLEALDQELAGLDAEAERAARRAALDQPGARAAALRDVRSYRRAVRMAHERGMLTEVRTMLRELFGAVLLGPDGPELHPRPVEDLRRASG